MAGKTVVVTGGSRGIGRAICQRFAADGDVVVAAARHRVELEETRSLIEAGGGKCLTQVVDLCAPDEIATLMESTRRQCGRIDVLVNNAGVAPLRPIEDLDDILYRAIMSVNVDAVFRACRAAWPVMRKQGGGVIVNISSVSAFDPFLGFAAYGAAKAWVNAWTRGIAEEGKPAGIRVFAVAPGAVETRMLRDPFPEFPRDQALQPADVAEVVFTLAQPACQYVSGQTVVVRK